MAIKFFAATGLFLLAATAPALADPASTTGAQPTTKTDSSDPNKVICRRIETIGSRLDSKRVCRTRGEWEADQLADRQAIERSQTQNWKNN
jgi:hypothetical protein